MNKQLEQYVETVAARLGTLPEAERTEQIAELRQHLESLVASAQTEGASEEAATETALRQFGDARQVGTDLNRSGWRMRLKRLPESWVTALSVVSGISLVNLLFRFGYAPLVKALVPTLPAPSGLPPHATITVIGSSLLAPSLFLGMLTLLMLLFRDGTARTVRRFLIPQTVTGAAFLWVVLSRLSQSLLMLGLNHALYASHLWDLQSLRTFDPISGFVPAAFTAWVVARLSPKAGVKGIAAGLLATMLLSFLDIAVASGNSDFLSVLYLRGFATTALLFSASTLPLALLASKLNKRQRHEQKA